MKEFEIPGCIAALATIPIGQAAIPSFTALTRLLIIICNNNQLYLSVK